MAFETQQISFRIQPGVEKNRDVFQTFKNAKTVMSGNKSDIIELQIVALLNLFTMKFQTWWTEADRPFVFQSLPSFWQVPGQLNARIYGREIAAGARTIEFTIDGWTIGQPPTNLAGPAQVIIPAGTDLVVLDIVDFAVDLTGFDLLGFFVANISHPTQTDYDIMAADLAFTPDTSILQPGAAGQLAGIGGGS